MLALRDENEGDTKINQPYIPNQPYVPYQPYTPYVKWCPIGLGGQCTNPFGDCINCPYHGGVTYNTICTNCTSDLNIDSNQSSQKDKDIFDFAKRVKKDNLT
jgi:hypothetical protein